MSISMAACHTSGFYWTTYKLANQKVPTKQANISFLSIHLAIGFIRIGYACYAIHSDHYNYYIYIYAYAAMIKFNCQN